jgi:hypothetical protein
VVIDHGAHIGLIERRTLQTSQLLHHRRVRARTAGNRETLLGSDSTQFRVRVAVILLHPRAEILDLRVGGFLLRHFSELNLRLAVVRCLREKRLCVVRLARTLLCDGWMCATDNCQYSDG